MPAKWRTRIWEIPLDNSLYQALKQLGKLKQLKNS